MDSKQGQKHEPWNDEDLGMLDLESDGISHDHGQEDTDEEEELVGEPIDDASDLIILDDDDYDDFGEATVRYEPRPTDSNLTDAPQNFTTLPTVSSEANTDIRSRFVVTDNLRESTQILSSDRTQSNLHDRTDNGIPSPPFCRICRDPGPELDPEPVVSTCLCRGTVARVHVSCLERWLAESDSVCCELCGCQYKTVRTPRYHVVRSIPAWIVSGGGGELLLDLITLFILTPVTLFGTYLALNADDTVFVQMTLMAAMDLVFSAWLVMRSLYHFTRWYSWWRRKSTVKLVLDRTQSKQL